MSNYSRVLAEFGKQGCNENDRFDQYEINQALDKIIQRNLHAAQFNREIAQELYEHTEKVDGSRILLKNYIKTIIDAQNILANSIRQTEAQYQATTDPHQLPELKETIDQFKEDYRLLSLTFLIKPSIDVGFNDKSIQGNQSLRNNNANESLNVSGFFADEPSNREESSSLRWTLIITLVIFLIEVILMFHRDHFLNILVYISILAIFFLNYFDQLYIRFCLVCLMVAIILDFIWVIVQSSNYMNPIAQTQHSTLQNGFLSFIFIFTIVLMILKILLIILLFRYRNNQEDLKKTVRILNLRFDLDGKATTNPISLLLKGNRNRGGPELQQIEYNYV